MKKLTLLLLTLPLFALASHDKIEIAFLNGDRINYTANSYWTEYNKHNDYYEVYEDNLKTGRGGPDGIYDADYVCISDYVAMNPVSRETKKDDYRTLRDKAESLGHACHYYDLQDAYADQYGVSFRYDDIKYIRINDKD